MPCRRLSEDEFKRTLEAFGESTIGIRDQALFLLGMYSGFRISELLSLRIRNIWDPAGNFWPEIKVQRLNMKGQKNSRSIPLYGPVKPILNRWRKRLHKMGHNKQEDYLFCTSQGIQLDRLAALKRLKAAFHRAQVYGQPYELGYHSLRKTFSYHVVAMANQARKEGRNVDAMVTLQKLLGHSKITSTMHYVPNIDEDVNWVKENLFK